MELSEGLVVVDVEVDVVDVLVLEELSSESMLLSLSSFDSVEVVDVLVVVEVLVSS